MEQKKITLFSFAGKYQLLTILGCILSGISAVLTFVPLICTWQMIREIFVVLPDVSKAQNLSYYAWMAVIFSVMAIFVYFLALLCTHLAAFRIATNIRSRTLHHVVKLPLGFFNENGSGKLRRVMDEVAGQTEAFLAHELPDLVGAIVTPIAMVVILLVFDWRLGLISLIPIIIGFLILSTMMNKSMKESMKKYQNALDDMNNQAVEYVRGIPVVKTFQQSIFSFKNFHDAIIRYKEWTVKYTISLRIPMSFHSVSINATFAFLIPAVILLIGTVSDYKTFLLSFLFYVIFTPICTVMMTRIMFAAEKSMMAKDAMERIGAILREEPLTESKNTQKPKDTAICFKNVTFTYKGSGTPAVNNVSFTIPQGKTYALVGPSGSGKSTIASMIPRFWDVDSGKITIGGVDVRNIKNEDLMTYVSFVFQQTSLFKQSLLDNIRAAKPNASREEVMAAVKVAQCEEIIEKMPNGLDTVVGTKGIYLSGGEVQRIALARAILKDAPIILLDEATAFADPENEYKIQLAFKELTRNKTVIMVAHRLSTIQNADCIMVINDGKITESGKHDELIAIGGLYNQMWNSYQSSVSWKIGRGVCIND